MFSFSLAEPRLVRSPVSRLNSACKLVSSLGNLETFIHLHCSVNIPRAGCLRGASAASPPLAPAWAHGAHVRAAAPLIGSASHGPTCQVNPVFICRRPLPFHTVTPSFLYLCSAPRGNQVLGSGSPQSTFRGLRSAFFLFSFFSLCL